MVNSLARRWALQTLRSRCRITIVPLKKHTTNPFLDKATKVTFRETATKSKAAVHFTIVTISGSYSDPLLSKREREEKNRRRNVVQRATYAMRVCAYIFLSPNCAVSNACHVHG
jgi:hypothetical protein